MLGYFANLDLNFAAIYIIANIEYWSQLIL
jgi:hypothetical protein